MNINNDNIELLVFRLKEGLLDEAERGVVEKALAENREWQEMADGYDPSLQVPQYPHVVYPHKDKLRSIARPARRIVVLPTETWVLRYVAAACALIIAFVLFLRINNSDKTDSTLLASNKFDERGLDEKTHSDKRGLDDNFIFNEHGLNGTNGYFSSNEHESDEYDEYVFSDEHESDEYDEYVFSDENESDELDSHLYIAQEEFITYIDENDTTYDYIISSAAGMPQLLAEGSTAENSTMENIVEYTNQLITFEEEDNSLPYSPQPQWRNSLNDWSSKLQIARLEIQTNMVTRLSRKLKNE